MSYAGVAAHNAPPHSQQPKPDQGLLNTDPPTTSLVTDDAIKVNLVAPNFKEDPATVTSESRSFIEDSDEGEEDHNVNGSEKRKRRARKQFHDVEAEAEGFWVTAKEQLLRPGVAGGLLGVVNVGLLGYASYALYTRPELRGDIRVLTVGGVSLFTLFGMEGYAAERYANTPDGQAERKRARKEGAALYRQSREAILRPGVLGGLVGLVNVGILGGVGYFAYDKWDAPRWDRRAVSAITVGLLGLWGVEGTLAEKYRESRK